MGHTPDTPVTPGTPGHTLCGPSTPALPAAACPSTGHSTHRLHVCRHGMSICSKTPSADWTTLQTGLRQPASQPAVHVIADLSLQRRLQVVESSSRCIPTWHGWPQVTCLPRACLPLVTQPAPDTSHWSWLTTRPTSTSSWMQHQQQPAGAATSCCFLLLKPWA